MTILEQFHRAAGWLVATIFGRERCSNCGGYLTAGTDLKVYRPVPDQPEAVAELTICDRCDGAYFLLSDPENSTGERKYTRLTLRGRRTSASGTEARLRSTNETEKTTTPKRLRKRNCDELLFQFEK